ncbi:MAG: XTP/dITP diphosphatase [Verrucomicrobia bacterium]|nr:XTP/dITP diphosphatase [Verrucomicrobiota bacterium]
MDLLLATGNTHKSREFQELLGDDFQISDLSSLPPVEMPKETGTTFEQNAVLKAASVSKIVGQLVIADDSGLEVDALGGAPGIYSARYAGEYASDAANIDKLLRELRNIEKRSARFRCVTALARAGKVLGTFDGVVEGTIIDPPRGKDGFGYDPVFQPAGFKETFAEMSPESKNKISHRAKAIMALRTALRALRN